MIDLPTWIALVGLLFAFAGGLLGTGYIGGKLFARFASLERKLVHVFKKHDAVQHEVTVLKRDVNRHEERIEHLETKTV